MLGICFCALYDCILSLFQVIKWVVAKMLHCRTAQVRANMDGSSMGSLLETQGPTLTQENSLTYSANKICWMSSALPIPNMDGWLWEGRGWAKSLYCSRSGLLHCLSKRQCRCTTPHCFHLILPHSFKPVVWGSSSTRSLFKQQTLFLYEGIIHLFQMWCHCEYE